MQQAPQGGGSFIRQLIFIVITAAVLFIFRHPLAERFGFADKLAQWENGHLPAMMAEKPASSAPTMEKDTALIVSDTAPMYQEPGGQPFATAYKGQVVKLLPGEESTQNGFVRVHHSGFDAWMNAADLEMQN